MINQDKMRALAEGLRAAGPLACREAADAIDLLLAEVEASDQKRKEAILDAEKARDERNRAHVKLNAEWIEKTNALRAELQAAAADKRDAERYRFLKWQARSDPKMNGQHVWYSIPMRNPNGGTLTGSTLDEAIDAALAQRQGEGS
ncbi:hypothetical protein [Burkholderia vietnamiensis]|uniref:hypothetical protein n=1 Tax=Burkholderia vietnamiensis TaxID=60552 RepID=UPI0026554490|nr:hypothetical protein [Burkholderia vietnamiensis]MDN7820473.1 hypothetical protein [Burkholderia vietnamiensis]